MTGTSGEIRRTKHDGTKWQEQALDGLIDRGRHQLLALGRGDHWGVDNMSWLVFAEHLGQHLHHVRAAQQSYLDDLWLQVVDDSLHLLEHHGGWQVVKLLNTQRVLYGDRGDG